MLSTLLRSLGEPRVERTEPVELPLGRRLVTERQVDPSEAVVSVRRPRRLRNRALKIRSSVGGAAGFGASDWAEGTSN